jgi:hypothetical protein
METVDYIKELKKKIKEQQKKIRELQKKINEKGSPRVSTPHTPRDMGRGSVPKITVHYYGTEQESDSTNPEKHSEGSSSRMEKDMDTGLSSPMVDTTPTGTSDATLQSLREKVASSPMDDHSTETVQTTSEEIPEWVSPEEELPELNTVEDLRQWLGLCSLMDATVETTSEEIPDMVIVSPEEEELPELNSIEDLRQWLGL